jgi:hypothetical protein
MRPDPTSIRRCAEGHFASPGYRNIQCKRGCTPNVIPDGQQGVACNAFRTRRRRCIPLRNSSRILAVADAQHGDRPVGAQPIARGVVRVLGHPWPRDQVEGLHAPGEFQIVDYLQTLVVDVLIDYVNRCFLFRRQGTPGASGVLVEDLDVRRKLQPTGKTKCAGRAGAAKR